MFLWYNIFGDYVEEIIKQAYLVADEIKKSEEYIKLKEYKIIVDDKYQKEIIDFLNIQEEYNKLLNDRFNNNFKEVSKKFVEIKSNLYLKEEVVKYLGLEKIIQNRLDDLSRELGNAVSKNINVPNLFGIINTIGGKHGK